MTLVAWSPSLSVGVGTIDEHHARLIGMINRLHSAMKLGQGAENVPRLLDELVDYTHYHFSAEEKMMKEKNYPAMAGHVAEHRAFTERLAQHQEGLKAGKMSLSIQVMQFLHEWLMSHIQRTDGKLGQFLKEHGSPPPT